MEQHLQVEKKQLLETQNLYFLSELPISNTGYIVSSLQKQGKKNNIYVISFYLK